ncbi:hypothetical protein [Candidatus Villigracilis affinis]|uniref:hypothetical protein n=1 Tax=Candidatus Villigracilis affinis TaxID=3140682 RepID=UPI002A234B14|nr:hypothetical protein [Anaerolineales bacterium]
MAKKDQTNGTPIEFQIPSAGGEGPRIPAPTNQPAIYGYKNQATWPASPLAIGQLPS